MPLIELQTHTGRGVIKPLPGTNFRIVVLRPDIKTGRKPKENGKKIVIPAGAGVEFQVINPPDGNRDVIYDAEVYIAQPPPRGHTQGIVVYRGRGEIAATLGPQKAQLDHPVLGTIQYIP